MSRTFEQYAEDVHLVFGDGTDPIATVAARATRQFPDDAVIVWEGDAQTFQFSFVSESAEAILGHPLHRWVSEATFWADHVVHPDDRDDAIGYCALATGKGRDHAFEYRAQAADGRTVHLLDYVQVVKGRKGIAERLRGIMIDVSAFDHPTSASRWRQPDRRSLELHP